MQIMITNAVHAFHTGAAYCCHLVISNLSPFSLSLTTLSVCTLDGLSQTQNRTGT